ncbi:glycosyltransferase family 2 protein [bacterium]|nr:glycosyltransferase family 2 protein [bacterium]MBO6042268.1 glycosyltransferase family 2 protein [bacterium]MBO6072057.1 glycosyltransferase family 2 protein [bacterium]
MNEKKILIVIPAYNEEKNILNTINNLKKNTTLDFIVVNDGSKDSTLKILTDNQIPYINHEINKGLSESLRTGMIYAINNNYDYILQMDGDNQHNPKDIINFSNNANNKNQIIIGNRYKNNKKG